MGPTAVLIRVSRQFSRFNSENIENDQFTSTRPFVTFSEDKSTCDFSGSGVLLEDNLVLTAASVVTPVLKQLNGEFTKELTANSSIQVLIDGSYRDTEVVSFIDPLYSRQSLQQLTFSSSSAWCFGFSSSDPLPYADLSTLDAFDLSNINTTCIIILKILQCEAYSNDFSSHETKRSENQIPVPGVPVHLVGSPYGVLAPQIFANCVFDGIVSNVVGLNKFHMDKENNAIRWRKHQNYGLIISDAMCMPGMEGGGCFDAVTKRLLGIVIPPIRRIDNQPCNFSLVVPMSSILPSLLHVLSLLRYRNSVTPRLENGNRETVLDWNFNSIVQLRIDNTWATGVIVHQKYVITNAHVIRPHLTALTSSHNPSLKCALSIDSSYTKTSLIPHRVVYISRSHFDICVIELKHAVPKEYVANLVSEQKWNSLQPGDPLMTVGYGVFPPISNLQASVTKGVLTRKISSGGNPILIITSTHVHQGTSGGGVFSPSGYLLGLVVNNIRTHDDIVYTKLNFAIPGIVISRVVTRLNAVLKRFEGYGCNDGPDLEAETRKVWKMFALDESGCKIWEMDDTRAAVDSDMKSKL